MQELPKVHVEKLLTISVAPDSLDVVVSLTENYAQVVGSQGIHPHDARLFDAIVAAKIKHNCQLHQKIVAIGEIGLDYHYQHSDPNIQKNVFEQQLQIAIELNKPVIIHTRDADEDTISILKNFSPLMKKKGVLHSFTSGKKLAEYVLAEGFFIGINGIVTFKNAQSVRDIVALTPINQILYETDSPFLAPTPHRGSENNPSYLPLVAKKIAEIKQVDQHEIDQIVFQQSSKLFGV
jgi:TatD DNase family protein